MASFLNKFIENRISTIVLIVLACTVLSVIRIQLVEIPLERDEGVFAYIGHRMFEGHQLYSEMADNKLPGLYFLYGLITHIFGFNPWGIHVGLWCFNILTLWALFFLFLHFFSKNIAIVAIFIFSVLIVSPNFLGFAAHATHFFLLPIILGNLIMVHALKSEQIKIWLVLSGMLFGAGFLIKQSAIFFVFAAIVYIAVALNPHKKETPQSIFQKLVIFSISAASPYILIILYFWVNKRLSEFWQLTYVWPSWVASHANMGYLLKTFLVKLWTIAKNHYAIFIFSFIGFIALFRQKLPSSKLCFAFGFLIAGIFSVMLGGYFYPHYFVVLIPGISLFSAVGFVFVWRFLMSRIESKAKMIVVYLACPLLLVVICCENIIANPQYYIHPNINQLSKSNYGINPFVESIKVAAFIKNHTQNTDKIAILGSEAQILVYADRISATRHLSMYPLVDGNPNARVFIEQFKTDLMNSLPAMILFVDVRTSWLGRSQPDLKHVYQFCRQFLKRHYQQVGVVKLDRPTGSEFIFDSNNKKFKQYKNRSILIFKRI